METVVNKSFIGDREVNLIAERFGTKFYVDNENKEIIYITNYDDVIAKINPNTDCIIDIDNSICKNETN